MSIESKNIFKQAYLNWLDRRLPLSSSITLTQKRIFIFPGRIGGLYLLLVTLLFITSINYQNNLLFSFSCLMVSLFVTAIVTTYKNLSGLNVQPGKTQSCFSGDVTNLEMIFSNNSHQERFAFDVGFGGAESYSLERIGEKTLCKIPIRTDRRGPLSISRIRLQSIYPLGLLRCWSWLNLNFNVWVYPKPIVKPIVLSTYRSDSSQVDTEDVQVQAKGESNDDFFGFKAYQVGDSLKHIAWRQFAKTQQLHTKEFSSEAGGSYWLDWYVLDGIDSETRLSILCGWVLQCDSSNQEFGLRLPDRIIEKSTGKAHTDYCLESLAKFGFADDAKLNRRGVV